MYAAADFEMMPLMTVFKSLPEKLAPFASIEAVRGNQSEVENHIDAVFRDRTIKMRKHQKRRKVKQIERQVMKR